MQGADCKERGESVGQPTIPSAIPCVSWWNGIVSQVPQPALYNPQKSLFLDHTSRVLGNAKQVAIQSQQLEQSSSQVSGQSQTEGEGVLRGTTRTQSMPTQSGTQVIFSFVV
eukprot:Gb_14804 [translate_table: standard]